MKRFILSSVMVIALLLNLLVISTFAFTPVGDVNIAKATPTIDGVLSAGEYPESGHVLINQENATTKGWAGAPNFPANTYIDIYFACDETNLYIAGHVTDPAVKTSVSRDYTGDAFQISLNVGNVFKSKDASSRAIFYSWGLQKDNMIDVVRQESKRDDVFMDAGKGALTDKGWDFEVALSWEQLIEDAEAKSGATVDFEGGKTKIGMLLCYLDYNANGALAYAFGTPKTDTMAFDPDNFGASLLVPNMKEENPKTNDALVAVLALAAVAGTAIVVSKKR